MVSVRQPCGKDLDNWDDVGVVLALPKVGLKTVMFGAEENPVFGKSLTSLYSVLSVPAESPSRL